MKKRNYIGGFLVLILVLIVFSCNNRKTYAEMVDDERESIQDFIAKKDLVILKSFPKDGVFKEKEYYRDSSGLYIHVEKLGGERKVRYNEMVLMWFEKKGPLPSDTLVASNLAYQHPDEFVYQGASSNTRGAFLYPLKYVGNYGKVKLIVPHALGTSVDQSNVLPYYYEVEYILDGLDN